MFKFKHPVGVFLVSVPFELPQLLATLRLKNLERLHRLHLTEFLPWAV